MLDSFTKNSEAATSVPNRTFSACPLCFTASIRTSNASVLSCTGGAKPPSSPTLQASCPYFFFSTDFNVWYTSAPMFIASRNVVAPTGRIMNSWQAKRFPAWEPPLITLKDGTGKRKSSSGWPARAAMCWNNRRPAAAAPARQTAMETASIALAPSFAFDQPHSFFDPSIVSTMSLSIMLCCVASRPISFGAIKSFTLATAFSTPFPRALFLSPSRSSKASYTPVDAPDGTEALN
mmetsp:Transcript_21344/g.49581  ORF Transcript_21344/g.49581 Transcript_21344/m.49581 type:complete len:235 (-) Transcript_21344:3154-3858(-)